MSERGSIRNGYYARQLCEFSLLRWNTITPTDIDGFIDFGNRLFILLEIKHSAAREQAGQRLALQRLADACSIPCYVIYGEHDVSPPDDIDAGTVLVREVYYKGKWSAPKQSLTMRQAIDKLRIHHGISHD